MNISPIIDQMMNERDHNPKDRILKLKTISLTVTERG